MAMTIRKFGKWAFRKKNLLILVCCAAVFQLFLIFSLYNIDTIEQNRSVQYIASKKKVFETTDKDVDVFPTHTFHQSTEPAAVHLACNVSGKDVTSALSRVKSKRCSQVLVDTYCQLQNQTLLPSHLPRYCSAPGAGNITHIGCFKDDKQERDLSGHMISSDHLTVNTCIYLCLRVGYQYAGVQYGRECHCGNTYGKHGHSLASSCRIVCSGDSRQTCGGFLHQNIYSTGLGDIKKRYAGVVGELHLPLTAGGESQGHDGAGTGVEPVRIVFVLTINGRAVRQVKRMLKTIYHSYHYYYIHIDSRQDYLYRELLPLERMFPNVHVAKERLPPIWGGASLLQMLLACMSDLLTQLSHWHWDFFINLSESDFPVKTLEQLTGYLTENRGLNFVKSHGKDTPKFIRKQGLEKLFVECENHMWRLGSKDLPSNIRVDGGSDWVALTRDFCQYVAMPPYDTLLTGLHQVWKYSLLPAESFFHTVLWNSAYCDTLVDNNLHLTNWRRKQGCKCQYKHIVDWCGCSPNDFLSDDLLKIKVTSQKPLYFARKFEAIIHQDIIRQVEVSMLNIDYQKYLGEDDTSLHKYWQNAYHHLDKQPVVGDFHRVFYRHLALLGLDSLQAGCVGANVSDKERVEEVSIYRDGDVFQGLLLFYMLDGGVKFESLMQPKPQLTLTRWKKRLVDMQVGCDFDLKEEVLRCVGGLLGPFSSPVLRLVWAGGPSLPYTIVWQNPIGHVLRVTHDSLDTSDSEMEENRTHHNLDVKTPLMAGSWNVTLLYSTGESAYKVGGQLSFLIIPLDVYEGEAVDDRTAAKLNGAASVRSEAKYVKMEETLDMLLVSSKPRRRALEMEVEEKWTLTGPELTYWVSDLVSVFWHHKASCSVGRQMSTCPIQQCAETPWSSRAPDMKSYLGNLNPLTGKLLP